jgi:dihydroorotate dehydrogenase electron transfer subunit
MAVESIGRVLQNRQITSDCFLLEIDCASIASTAVPGQFVMLKTSEDDHPILRRPFSFYRCYSPRHSEPEKRGRVSLLVKKVGAGTTNMRGFREGQDVSLIGPLGTGYTPPPLPSSAKTILIAGGIGIASLCFLAESLRSENLSVFIGGKTGQDVLCLEDFRSTNARVFAATEDGSLGARGTVIDLFFSQSQGFRGPEPQYLYACGPTGMLRALAARLEPGRFISQVSLESRMACGFGACWGCVVRTTDPETPYQRVCKEGPVFFLERVAWNNQ